jgi:predicted nucleotidyltransferase
MSLMLEQLAEDVGASERTLRRAWARGLVRGTRVSPHRLELPVQERAYLRGHWSTLSLLQAALRTEPNVSLAVLFGSVARGDEAAGSDVDILIALREPGVGQRVVLAERLRARTGLPVEVVALEDALRRSSLMVEILRDGRVLVDREGGWSKLLAQSGRIGRQANRDRRLKARHAREAAATFAQRVAVLR